MRQYFTGKSDLDQEIGSLKLDAKYCHSQHNVLGCPLAELKTRMTKFTNIMERSIYVEGVNAYWGYFFANPLHFGHYRLQRFLLASLNRRLLLHFLPLNEKVLLGSIQSATLAYTQPNSSSQVWAKFRFLGQNPRVTLLKYLLTFQIWLPITWKFIPVTKYQLNFFFK